jgi:hypothetical protein
VLADVREIGHYALVEGRRACVVGAIACVVFGVAATACGSIVRRQADLTIDGVASGVASRMSLEGHYLDEHLSPDYSAKGALARDAQRGGGDVLRADGDVRDKSGAVIVARFTATETDSPGGTQRTVAQCRKFNVKQGSFHVDMKRVTCPQGTPLSIPADHRGWRKCPGVAIWRPVDAPPPCNPGG